MSQQFEEARVLQAWQGIIEREAKAVELRIERLARKMCCAKHLLMDALTIELTGRFLGREIERRRTENKILAHQLKQ
jgi:hypothetical protein